jgi:hypothetical protein
MNICLHQGTLWWDLFIVTWRWIISFPSMPIM